MAGRELGYTRRMTEQPQPPAPDRDDPGLEDEDIRVRSEAGPEQLAGEPPAELQREGGGELATNEEPPS